MSKKKFMAQQALFFIQFPDADLVQYYQWYCRTYPRDQYGWFYLAEELMHRGELIQAELAYKRVIALGGSLKEPATQAVQQLASILESNPISEPPRKKRRFAKILLSLIVLLMVTFWHIVPPSNSSQSSIPPIDLIPSMDIIEQEMDYIWVEMVNIGDEEDQLFDRLMEYWRSREADLGHPVSLLVVRDATIPAWTPQLFTHSKQPIGAMKWDPTCACVIPSLDGRNPTETLELAQKYDEQQAILENWLILRSAIYQYYRNEGHPPSTLDDLTKSFPYNYLSRIDLLYTSEGVEAGKEVRYLPQLFQPDDAWVSLDEVLPLQFDGRDILVPYELSPVSIEINKERRTLSLLSGDFVLRQYKIGLGKDDSTPNGTFTITKKVDQPVSNSKMYGTRGMELSDPRYAIHGTNAPESVGQYISYGCIRLLNHDIEELFALTPLGTEVNVIQAGDVNPFQNPEWKVRTDTRADEHSPTIYRWLK